MSELGNKNIEKKNIDYFSNNEVYLKNKSTIDSYINVYNKLTEVLKNTSRLLDVGHGGSFDYDTSQIKEIVGLDLDEMTLQDNLPSNIKLECGSALNIPEHLKDFDKVLFMFLLHHLVGNNIEDNLSNLNKCINESKKTLNDNGKIIIVESCVPKWFYIIEKILFKPSSYFIKKLLKHPPAFQYTKEIIIDNLKKNNFKNINVEKVEIGKFILQYGFKFPSILTPVKTFIFVADK